MRLTKVSYSSLEKACPSRLLQLSCRTRRQHFSQYAPGSLCARRLREVEVCAGRVGVKVGSRPVVVTSRAASSGAWSIGGCREVEVCKPFLSLGRHYSNTRKTNPSSNSQSSGLANAPPLTSLLDLLKRNDTIYADSFQDCVDLICSSEVESLRFSGTLCENRAGILGKALENNKSLAVLDLKWNDIDDKAALVIAQSLRRNEALVALDLSQNRITNSGALALAESMVQTQQSSLLYLCDNPIEDPRSIQAVLENSDHYVVL